MKIEDLTEVDEDSLLTNSQEYDTLSESAISAADSFLVTKITGGVKDKNRVNIFIDRRFDFSLDISQLVDAKLKVGQTLTESELENLRHLSDFGKLYQRTLEYTLTRPHSEKEIRDYLKKKTTPGTIRTRDRETGRYVTKPKITYPKSLVAPVLDRLRDKGHIDDARFARFMVENYHARKGASSRQLSLRLRQKGVSEQVISEALAASPRDESEEIAKIITKKRAKYDDQKLITYLTRRGFDYEKSRAQVLETGSQSSE